MIHTDHPGAHGHRPQCYNCIARMTITGDSAQTVFNEFSDLGLKLLGPSSYVRLLYIDLGLGRSKAGSLMQATS